MRDGKSLFILGIDGGTFDVVLPMIRNGELPTLNRLMKEGVYGELNSTLPPMTPPAWSSFATGLNPGKHGVYDFTERVPGTYSVRFVNASMRHGKNIWTIASEFGKRVAVMAVPFTYPPDRVNGVMISGIDAPGGAKSDPRVIMYPPHLYDELIKNVGPYIITSSPVKYIYGGDMKLALDRILEAVERKGDTAKYLIQKDNWDLFIMVFGETDLVGHHFWKYHDPNSPFYERTLPEINDAVRTVYGTIDRKIGEMLSLFPNDASVMVVSDHGFGGNGDVVIHLNRVLEEMGFLRFKGFASAEYISALILDRVKKMGLKLTPQIMRRELIKKQRGGIVNKMESWLRFSLIDWSQTLAYSEETPYFPLIWINLKGREPKGIVSPGAEYERVREDIIRRLAALKDPFTGTPVVKAAYKREEIYTGPYVEKAPDIIIDWNNPNGYSYMSRSSLYSKNKGSIRRFTKEEMKSDGFRNKSGNHRQYGIFIACGGVFEKGKSIEGAQIIDIAPTALYIQGIPIPKTMDGRVLTQAISPEFLANHDPVFSEDINEDGADAHPYTEEESEIIRRRLKDLGYLE
ncbi:MAG: hypothetical protein C4291_09030 [Candidatus Dadabacteria bacterium]